MPGQIVVRQVWNPEQARQAARDAAKHQPEIGVAIEPEAMAPDVLEPPYARDGGRTCPSCGAWAFEECDPGCLSQLTPEEQQWHRDAVLDRTLDDLDLLEQQNEEFVVLQCSIGAARRRAARHRAVTGGGMRPRRAAMIARILITVAAVVIVASLGVLWATGAR